MIWVNPWISAQNPTQNRIRNVRLARLNSRSELETQKASRISRIQVIRPTHQYRFSSREATARTRSNAP